MGDIDSSDDDSDSSDSSSDDDDQKTMPTKKVNKKVAAKKDDTDSDDSSDSSDSSDEDDDVKSKPMMNGHAHMNGGPSTRGKGSGGVVKTGGTGRFQRVKVRDNFENDALRDNSFDACPDPYALKANDKLRVTRGKNFTKAKNKQKRKTMH